MNYLEVFDVDPGKLARRRQLSAARRQREGDREAVLDRFARSTARADALRSWINAYEGAGGGAAHPELHRMLDWARAELNELKAILDPGQLCALLRDKELFPEIDKLEDPLGEPPPRVGWGR